MIPLQWRVFVMQLSSILFRGIAFAIWSHCRSLLPAISFTGWLLLFFLVGGGGQGRMGFCPHLLEWAPGQSPGPIIVYHFSKDYQRLPCATFQNISMVYTKVI